MAEVSALDRGPIDFLTFLVFEFLFVRAVAIFNPRRTLSRWRSVARVSREVEDLNRRLLRARDAMDRAYAEPLDVRAVAAVAHVSEAHFIRSFRAVFGETPHRYLQRRRVERSMFLLRETDRSVTDICFDVGFTSLGTFSRTFREIVGETPSDYRAGPRADGRAQLRPDGGHAAAGRRRRPTTQRNRAVLEKPRARRLP